MTPWHRFWFPHGDETPAATRDAALWTPQAIAETQRALWQHAAQAAEDWWRYWRTAWPGVPLQPPIGVVVPPPDKPAEEPAVEHAPRKAVRGKARPVSAKAAPASARGRRPQRTARGK